jgi:hypothetical protein
MVRIWGGYSELAGAHVKLREGWGVGCPLHNSQVFRFFHLDLVVFFGIIYLFLFLLFICAYNVWVISPRSPWPPLGLFMLAPLGPQLPGLGTALCIAHSQPWKVVAA